jgi:hypothetical protein
MVWFELLLFLVWIIGFPYLMIGLRKAPSRLQDWADRHRLKIIDRRVPLFTWKGPFPGRSSSQTLFRAVFEDNKGERRSAWVLCGSPLRGSWVDQVDVRWDETEVSPPPTAFWFETQAGRRFLVRSMGGLGIRCLFLGPCVGLCLGVAMLLSTGLFRSPVAPPLLVISVVLGVVVGGLLGMVGGAVLAWRKHDTKLKSVIYEL